MEESDSPFVSGCLLCCYWPCLHITEYNVWREDFMPENSVLRTWNCGWTVWSCTGLFLSLQGRTLLDKSCTGFQRWAVVRSICCEESSSLGALKTQEAGCPETETQRPAWEKESLWRDWATVGGQPSVRPWQHWALRSSTDRLTMFACFAPLASFSIHLTHLSPEGWHHFLNYSLKILRMMLAWDD